MRPEALRLLPESAAGEINSARAHVRRVQFAGETTEVWLALAGGLEAKALIGSDAGAAALAEGDAVTAAFAADDAAILDPEEV